MDNLQKYYIEQLQFAVESALHGNTQACLNICFELRVKADLALWTRAYLNIILATVTRVQTHPDKAKFAAEALRLARELKADRDVGDNAAWRDSYERLETSAQALLVAAQHEQEELDEAWQHESETSQIEEKMQGLQFREVSSDVEIEYLDHEHQEQIEPWQIEGAFSVIPTSQMGSFTPAGATEDDEIDDELGVLPAIADPDKTKISRRKAISNLRSGLITPAATSDIEED